jgi:TPR repeat protein
LSADQDSAEAQFNYGFLLLHSDAIAVNKSLAAHYFKLSADQGYPMAQLQILKMLFWGDEIAVNKFLAAHYFKSSADQGCVIAQFIYSLVLSRGDGIAMNKSLAARSLRLPGNQGDSRTRFEYDMTLFLIILNCQRIKGREQPSWNMQTCFCVVSVYRVTVVNARSTCDLQSTKAAILGRYGLGFVYYQVCLVDLTSPKLEISLKICRSPFVLL